jgi:pimeloyl-ACP methyl ester carboxylesterase
VGWSQIWGRGYRPAPDQNEQQIAFYGTRPLRTNAVPVIMCHGYNVLADAFVDTTGAALPAEWHTARGIGLANGFGLAIDAGGLSTWGIDAVVAPGGAIDDAIAYAAAQYGTRTDKVALYGTSMGAANVLGWAWRNPGKVHALVTTIGLLGLDSLRIRNVLGLGDVMVAVYGGLAAFQAAVPTHDPLANLANLAPLGDRMHLFYSPTDLITPGSEVDQFVAATGCAATNVGNDGHTLTTWNPQMVLDWLVPRLWP